MTRLQLAVCTSTLLALAACLVAGPLVHYEGTECGGMGPRGYTYILAAEKGVPIMELHVGTSDLDEHHYTDVLTPEGWFFAVEQGGPGHAGGACTAIGEISPGPVRSVSIGKARWWTDKPESAIESFTFGFTHPWYAEDVSWRAQSDKDVFTGDWEAPVGEGAGPVHGPYSPTPEPASAALLLACGIGLLRRRARH